MSDDQLGNATPCPDDTVGDLLEHVSGLSQVFAEAARKETSLGDPGPSGDRARDPAAPGSKSTDP